MTSQKKSKLTNNLIESVLTDLKKNDSSSSDSFPFDKSDSSPVGANNSSPVGANNSSPFGTNNSSPFGTNNSSPFGTNNSSPFGTNNSSPFGRKDESIFSEESREAIPIASVSDIEAAAKVKASAIQERRSQAALAANKSMPLIEADLKQSENLKIAQNRILELESSIETLRLENENLTAAQQVARERDEDISLKVQSLERSKIEIREQWSQEIAIYKDNLATRDTEVQRLRTRIDELENRLQSDLRRVRVRERELENRLEIGKNDKIAMIKAKDETILDLKRKMDQLYSDLEKYKLKSLELSRKIDANNEQFGRTTRALRIALANLEAAEDTKSTSLSALKKVD